MKIMRITLIAFLGLVGVAAATINLETTPCWQSTDQPGGEYPYSTGCDWADVDGDGDIDLVVSNGNDIVPGYCAVYYNDGGLETEPSWTGTPNEYHGHCECADFDADGDPDLAAALLGGGNPWSYEYDVLYTNDGGYEASPSWEAHPGDNGFGMTWGDYDGDGDLDLAMACGVDYVSRNEPLRIYENQNGTLTTDPAWESDRETTWMDVLFADFDNDGYLDLAAAAEHDSNVIFFGGPAGLPTSFGWEDDDGWDSIRLAAGDVNDDGWLDLAVANNNQSAGQQDILYLSSGGLIDNTPDWQSSHSEMSSFVALADIDADGDLDMATGGWWEPIRIYENHGGSFSTQPEWTSQLGYNPVTEALLFGDYDDDGLETSTDTFNGDGAAGVFQLAVLPVRSVDEVRVAGSPLAADEWCVMRQEGVVSLGDPPGDGEAVEIDYTWSRDLDLAQTDWLDSRPNVIFNNAGNVDSGDIRLLARLEDGGVLLEWSADQSGVAWLYRQDLVAEPVLEGPLGRHARAYRRALALGNAGVRTGGRWLSLNESGLSASGAYLDRGYGDGARYLVELVGPDGSRRRSAPVEVVGPEEDRSTRLVLSDPWPSPARGSVNCRLELPADCAGAVEAALYDLAGRRVATVFAGELTAGRHPLTFSSAGLSGGVYLLRLTAGGRTVTRRFVVAR
jgi:hypothetical protein